MCPSQPQVTNALQYVSQGQSTVMGTCKQSWFPISHLSLSNLNKKSKVRFLLRFSVSEFKKIRESTPADEATGDLSEME